MATLFRVPEVTTLFRVPEVATLFGVPEVTTLLIRGSNVHGMPSPGVNDELDI